MTLLSRLAEAAVLSAALALDGFTASLAYAASGIRIPIRSALTINILCTLTLMIPFFAGDAVAALLPEGLLALLSAGILFGLGLFKCFSGLFKALLRRKAALPFRMSVYLTPEAADTDRSRVLSVREAVSLALALSLDGMTAGFGAAFGPHSAVLLLLCTLCANAAAFGLGACLGGKLARLASFDLSWAGGFSLLFLALGSLLTAF